MAIGAIHAVLWGRWRSSTRAMAVVLCGIGVIGCADLREVQSDMTQLRADVQAQHAALAALTARLEAVERRASAVEQGAALSPYELQQAIEVLLKKALEVDTRLTQLETVQVAGRRSERPPRSDPHPALEARSNPNDERKEISLGMTQDDVRRLFGDPLSTEYAGPYIFWQYAPLRDQKYVIFDREGGRVSGWRGL